MTNAERCASEGHDPRVGFGMKACMRCGVKLEDVTQRRITIPLPDVGDIAPAVSSVPRSRTRCACSGTRAWNTRPRTGLR